MNEEINKQTLNIQLSPPKKPEGALQTITITVLNESSVLITGAIVTVSDADTNPNTVQQVRFGQLPSGDRSTQYTNLPSGYEFIHAVVTANGQDIPYFGTGVNITDVRIHLTD